MTHIDSSATKLCLGRKSRQSQCNAQSPCFRCRKRYPRAKAKLSLDGGPSVTRIDSSVISTAANASCRVIAQNSPLNIPELLDECIGYLSLSSSPSDLAACARVARAWLAVARVYIYRSLNPSIGSWKRDGGQLKALRLYRSLSNRPDLLSMIRELTLDEFHISSEALDSIGLLRFTVRLELPVNWNDGMGCQTIQVMELSGGNWGTRTPIEPLDLSMFPCLTVLRIHLPNGFQRDTRGVFLHSLNAKNPYHNNCVGWDFGENEHGAVSLSRL
ncbi:hypothetical protein R3P38DRAFT_2816745 [Favolaschia claudopus]|uniref:F-box domain-containing protein n=1 Tax=Favolaschia claudopus TaxID=2862362 RepID=A0AAV9YYC8_9AGAR